MPIVKEIQGLRALAVLLVLAYHIRPEWVPGGYVGVDVFFVISGYLITGLLLRELRDKGSISLTNFYARRIKRLLPAATFVLICTAAASIFFLPQTRWVETSNEIIASALYFENWWLYFKEVDYLAAGYSSPVRHYWSLSVEEQFYIFWPIALLLVSRIHKAAVAVFIAFSIAASLSWSVIASLLDAGTSYFSSLTRIWELALGGMIALIPRPKIKGFLTAGLIAIFIAAFLYGDGTLFPGFAALLPTLGAVAVIMGSSSVLLSSRPMQYLGDSSYSLYLWHWPVIVFYSPRSLLDCLVVILISILLAGLSKRFIEDPFRYSKTLFSRRRYSFGAAIVCVCVSALSAGVVNTYANSPINKEIKPAPTEAKNDIPSLYKDGCHADEKTSEAKRCIYGEGETVVLVGDSHAAQWLPALQEIGEWKIITFTKSSCPFSGTRTYLRKNPYESCDIWYRNVLEEIKRIKPKYVFTSQYVGHLVVGSKTREESVQLFSQSLSKTWGELIGIGTKVIAIRDTPNIKVFDPADCMALKSVEECTLGRGEAFKYGDPIIEAAKITHGVLLVDLSDSICRADACRPVENGILVYRDVNHLTATYVRSLAKEFYNQTRL